MFSRVGVAPASRGIKGRGGGGGGRGGGVSLSVLCCSIPAQHDTEGLAGA